jgi:hypothetical protein
VPTELSLTAVMNFRTLSARGREARILITARPDPTRPDPTRPELKAV